MCCFSLFVIHIQHLLFWLQVLKKLFHNQLGFFNFFFQKMCLFRALTKKSLRPVATLKLF